MARDNATIMDGDFAWDLEYDIIKICKINYEDYLDDNNIFTRKIFEEHFYEIVKLVESCGHIYLGYQVLGYFILRTGSKITRVLKDKILRHAQWKLEKDFWKLNPEFIEERKYFLNDFREKIINYIPGHVTHLATTYPDK